MKELFLMFADSVFFPALTPSYLASSWLVSKIPGVFYAVGLFSDLLLLLTLLHEGWLMILGILTYPLLLTSCFLLDFHPGLDIA